MCAATPWGLGRVEPYEGAALLVREEDCCVVVGLACTCWWHTVQEVGAGGCLSESAEACLLPPGSQQAYVCTKPV